MNASTLCPLPGYPSLPDRRFRRPRRIVEPVQTAASAVGTGAPHVSTGNLNLASSDYSGGFAASGNGAGEEEVHGASKLTESIRVFMVEEVERMDFRNIDDPSFELNARDFIASLDSRLFTEFRKTVLDRHAEAVAVAMEKYSSREEQLRGNTIFDDPINNVRLRTAAWVDQKAGAFNLPRIANTVAADFMKQLEDGALTRSDLDGVINRTVPSSLA